MTRRTRRSVLAAVGGSLPLLAGCSDGTTPERPGTESETGTPTATPRATKTETNAPTPTVRLEPSAPPTGDATLLAYPTDLRSWPPNRSFGSPPRRTTS